MESKVRVVIVDFNHLAHTYYHSRFRLSVKENINGTLFEKDTTVQSGVLKAIARWSNGGSNYVVVCFDRPVPSRKAYFDKYFGDGTEAGGAYKGGRPELGNDLYQAMEDCYNILKQSGCVCLAEHNYEADDLIKAVVDEVRNHSTTIPIDIVTNDADLVPLVDEQVSVFLRSRITTYAESKEIEKTHYVQITPDNYQEYLEGLSAFKGFLIPYNTVLLHKLLRGDSADNIKGIKKLFPPRKYNAMIESMMECWEDLGVFRYEVPQRKVVGSDGNLLEGQEWVTNDKDLKKFISGLSEEERKNIKLKYIIPENLNQMVELVAKHAMIKEEEVDMVKDHIKKLYFGMNLNQPYTNKIENLRRNSYILNQMITKINLIDLHKACMPLKIKIVK